MKAKYKVGQLIEYKMGEGDSQFGYVTALIIRSNVIQYQTEEFVLSSENIVNAFKPVGTRKTKKAETPVSKRKSKASKASAAPSAG